MLDFAQGLCCRCPAPHPPRPGMPTDNANVESFHGRLCQECLNATRFMSLHGARGEIDTWRRSQEIYAPETTCTTCPRHKSR